MAAPGTALVLRWFACMTTCTGHTRGLEGRGPVPPSGLGRTVFALLAALLLAVPTAGRAEEETLPDTATLHPASGDVLPAVAEPFHAGESLRFSVQYGFIHAGSAWLEVPEVTEWQGHRVWRLVARAKSNRFIDGLYKVRTEIESLWDHEGRFSRRYIEHRLERHEDVHDTTTFEADSLRMRDQKGRVYPVPGPLQDALSSFYKTRFLALPVGGRVPFNYFASRRTSLLEVRVLGRETINTPAGRFKCVVIEPLLKAGGIFSNKGRLVIWLTDDERRMPVLMKSKVAIGSIKVVLQDYRTGSE